MSESNRAEIAIKRQRGAALQAQALKLFEEADALEARSASTCPECRARVIEQWSGVKCSRCSWWECF
jgi:hypothetical protein